MTPRDLCELQTRGLPRPTAAAAALWAASLLEQRLLPSHHPGLWEDLSFPVFQVTLPEVPLQIFKHDLQFSSWLWWLWWLWWVSLHAVASVTRGAALWFCKPSVPRTLTRCFLISHRLLFVFQPSVELTWLEPDLPLAAILSGTHRLLLWRL